MSFCTLHSCHSERSEESFACAQGKLREELKHILTIGDSSHKASE